MECGLVSAGNLGMSAELIKQPHFNRRHHMRPLGFAQLAPRGHGMPFLEAAPAAGRRRMLRNKDWMSAERRLLPVVHRLRRRQPSENEIAGMLENDGHSLRLEIRPLARPQRKTPSKSRLGQSAEDVG